MDRSKKRCLLPNNSRKLTVMLRITPSRNAAGTAKYFKEALVKGDYYSGEKNSVGQWNGKLAERLGLSGDVQQEDFIHLIHNMKPDGSKLNPRNDRNRKCGYDFTFSVSKSVSLVYALTGDERIREAFAQSVEETMQELERDIRFQQGQGKDKQLVKSDGGMIWASFCHKTGRPVDGVPDPHLHIHAFAMNTTWNEKLQRFQAAEFSTIKRAGNYYEAAADSRLAKKMVELGYQVERRGLSWEIIVGIKDSTLKKFSRRTEEIEKAAKLERAKSGALSAKQKEKLGALTRAKKIIHHSWEELKEIWRSWLSDSEVKQINQTQNQSELHTPFITAKEAIERAENHLFQRKSVIRQTNLKAEALKRSFGDLLPEDIEKQINQQNYFRKEMKDQTYLTNEQALEQERKLLAFVRASKGTHAAINAEYNIVNDMLTEEQKQAVQHALNDRNQITLISGGAGTGKTTLMREVQNGVIVTGKKFHAFAPTAAASKDVMRKEGFGDADTVASLLCNPKIQDKIKNGYVWIDESGLLGISDMNRLFEIAKKQNARLLLTGDTRQHTAIAAGNALQILESDGGLKVARVSKIQRQRNNPRFKQIVAHAAKGEIDKALLKLDRQGGVTEIPDAKLRLKQLVKDYTQAVKLGQNCLVISPTHLEGRSVTDAIRQALKSSGEIRKQERSFVQYQTSHHTDEQKGDSFYYQSSEPKMIEFHQNAQGGFKKGERWKVALDGQGKPAISRGLVSSAVPYNLSSRFTLYHQKQLKLAVGDKIRITKNAKTVEGTRIHNGSVYRITGFTRKGDIKLHTGKTLDKDFGHLDYGYLRTSYSSQGMTVDKVFIAQSSLSFGATSQQQLYVSLSRAREGAKIYTDDKRELERAVRQEDKQMTAREVAEFIETRQRRYSKSNKSNHYQKQNKSHGKEPSL